MHNRDFNWRQGSVLDEKIALALNLFGDSSQSPRVVIITHDCDLANEGEDIVEVIVGKQVPTSNPMFIGSQNPRRLDLMFTNDSSNQEPVYIRLCHSGRRTIPKKELLKFQQGNISLTLSNKDKRILKQWLAARYGRPAFPDNFESRLRKKKGKKTVVQQIDKFLRPDSDHLIGLFFDLGEEKTVELPDGTPYYLSIAIVYDGIEGGKPARIAAEQAAEELRELFTNVYGPVDSTTEIGLERCEAVSDTEMRLSDLRKVDQWRLEHISLSDNPAGKYLPVGETPI